MGKILFVLVSLFFIGDAHAQTIQGLARIIDGDTIEVAGTKIRLHGIDAPELGQNCKGVNGAIWDCGKVASNQLRLFIGGDAVACFPRGHDAFQRVVASCQTVKVDLNASMVAFGMAWAFVKFSNDYVAIENQAKAGKVGIWQAANQTAWDFRGNRWAGETAARAGKCIIKGNINRKGERIYHAPWSRSYKRTRVSEHKGERWFCDEAEALAAGWRAPYN